MNTKNKAASDLAKLSHKKSPRSKEFYKRMGALGVEAKKKKRLERKTEDE